MQCPHSELDSVLFSFDFALWLGRTITGMDALVAQQDLSSLLRSDRHGCSQATGGLARYLQCLGLVLYSAGPQFPAAHTIGRARHWLDFICHSRQVDARLARELPNYERRTCVLPEAAGQAAASRAKARSSS